jgi:hypothetical protein
MFYDLGTRFERSGLNFSETTYRTDQVHCEIKIAELVPVEMPDSVPIYDTAFRELPG